MEETANSRPAAGKPPAGENCHLSTLSAPQVIDIRKRHAAGEPIVSLARAFRVSRGCIRNIVRRKTWKSIAVVVLLVLSASPAFAWNAVGHMVVAEIAWQQLKPEQRQEIVDTLKRHPRFGEDFLQKMPSDVETADEATRDRWIFWQAAVWPDVARGIRGPEKQLYDRGTWHYINLPIYVDRRDEAELARRLSFNRSFRYPVAGGENQYNIIQALQHCKAALASKSASVEVKAIAYSWLFHLVGDLHQPMHSSALVSVNQFPHGDRGGNSFLLSRGGNLHSLWDNLLGRSNRPNNIKRIAIELADRERYGHVWESSIKSKNQIDWLKESHELAKSFAYDPSLVKVVRDTPPGTKMTPATPSDDYLKAAGEYARQRIIAAGLRLGNILSDE